MIMEKTILITGGFGFLGRAAAQKFKQLGHRVIGIGHGGWAPQEALAYGFDMWMDADVNLSSLMTLPVRFDLVVHCAGNGSVGYSLTNPLQDFNKTVQSIVELIEYMRLIKSDALLVYPSSAGVYGAKDDTPIKECDTLNPISPYGYHKMITEYLLRSYSKTYGIRVAIIRFFSIYGQGLTKQLLWDASTKILASKDGVAIFSGTGAETRDWINSEDAAELLCLVSKTTEDFSVINGACGVRVTIKETLEMLQRFLRADIKITFNGDVRKGDPHFYHADVSKALAMGWKPSTPITKGIRNYASWFIAHSKVGVD